ncbi:MAG: hypothetical protein WCQ91_00985 [Planctomycetota bacterium]
MPIHRREQDYRPEVANGCLAACSRNLDHIAKGQLLVFLRALAHNRLHSIFITTARNGLAITMVYAECESVDYRACGRIGLEYA